MLEEEDGLALPLASFFLLSSPPSAQCRLIAQPKFCFLGQFTADCPLQETLEAASALSHFALSPSSASTVSYTVNPSYL